MNRLEKIFLRVIILVIVLFVVVYFMLDKKEYTVPELKPLPKMFLVADSSQKSELAFSGIDIKAAKETEFAMDSITYEKPTFARAFGARSKEVRLILAKMNGGGDDTENAVELALGYFARIQKEDGSWSASSPLGSTGLCLNSFLGAGYHHQDGDYKEVVRKGLDYLLSRQNENGSLKGETLYSAGIAGVVFAEAYGLTGDEKCKTAAEKMVAYLVKSQGPKGAWYYTAWTPDKGETYDYDTSVTGWVMMAFKSAKMAGLKVPQETIDKYMAYSRLVTMKNGLAFYGIRKNVAQEKSHNYTMTASTLMCRLYMGESKGGAHIAQGITHITTTLQDRYKAVWNPAKEKMDNYMWYHAAQVGFLVGGNVWKFWNVKLRALLIKNQIKEGDKKGAWENEYFRWGTRSEVYGTALNVMILETYYRYYH